MNNTVGKMTIVSRALRTFPRLTRPVLCVWAEYLRRTGHRPTWRFKHAANAVGYRHPVRAKLWDRCNVIVPWNEPTGRAIYRDGCDEIDTVSTFADLVKPGMTVVDVGAHVGQFTLIASELVGPAGRVVSFEPDPRTIEWLRRNVVRTGAKNVLVEQVALSASHGDRCFNLSPASHSGKSSLVNRASSQSHCTVRCSTLDEYLASHGIESVDLIKMDVEGAECAALSGAVRLLERDDRPDLIVEFNDEAQAEAGHSCKQLGELLQGFGYKLARISSTGTVSYDIEVGFSKTCNVLAYVPRLGCAVERCVSHAN